MKSRVMESEWLDEMPAADPEAAASRRDLRRINFLMQNAAIVGSVLSKYRRGKRDCVLADLGAGDGSFALRLLRYLAPQWSGGKVILVDRQDNVNEHTRIQFSALGWDAQVHVADIFDWLAQPAGPPAEIMIANLFLHHFDSEKLSQLLALAAKRTEFFVACEPRRSRFSLTASRLLGLIGCNAVTRHDARASVLAGFAGRELSALWPEEAHWQIEERQAGLFSHCFRAERPPHRRRECE